jgi:dTDP-4-dehydrorhamnose 3,5-epimerase
MLEVRELALPGVFEIRPRRIGDDRGFFSETWSAAAMAEAGFAIDFVQDNHSYSREQGVLRGLHYQAPPMAQAKLVRASRGSVFDVAVDIRPSSPHYGRWTGIVLSAQAWNQILIPTGFAHGFVTLEPDCEVQYKVTARYSAAHDRCLHYADPAIGIDWPVPADSVRLSAKDAAAPTLAASDTGFA